MLALQKEDQRRREREGKMFRKSSLQSIKVDTCDCTVFSLPIPSGFHQVRGAIYLMKTIMATCTACRTIMLR